MNGIQSQRWSRSPKRLKMVTVGILLASTSFLNGCSHSPTFNLLGSYFPAWMICAVIGGVFTYVTHLVLARMKVAYELWPFQITYTLVLVFWTCSIWIVFFSS
jgi:YtcA family